MGPDGAHADAPATADLAGLDAEQIAFLRGLEGIIDRALGGHRPGESFVYGIYQELDPPVVEFLVRRYRTAGWAEVKVNAGMTGAHMLVLIP